MFVKRLVAFTPWEGRAESLSKLPASRIALEELFGSVVTADKFFAKQACFCTVILRKGEEINIKVEDAPTAAAYPTAAEETILLLLSGEPIDEPIVSYGPFVMNTQSEIIDSIREFQSGKYGVLE